MVRTYGVNLCRGDEKAELAQSLFNTEITMSKVHFQKEPESQIKHSLLNKGI